MKPFNLYYHVPLETKYLDLVESIHQEINHAISRVKHVFDHNAPPPPRSRFTVGKHVQLSEGGLAARLPEMRRWIGIVTAIDEKHNRVTVSWNKCSGTLPPTRVAWHEPMEYLTEVKCK